MISHSTHGSSHHALDQHLELLHDLHEPPVLQVGRVLKESDQVFFFYPVLTLGLIRDDQVEDGRDPLHHFHLHFLAHACHLTVHEGGGDGLENLRVFLNVVHLELENVDGQGGGDGDLALETVLEEDTLLGPQHVDLLHEALLHEVVHALFQFGLRDGQGIGEVLLVLDHQVLGLFSVLVQLDDVGRNVTSHQGPSLFPVLLGQHLEVLLRQFGTAGHNLLETVQVHDGLPRHQGLLELLDL